MGDAILLAVSQVAEGDKNDDDNVLDQQANMEDLAAMTALLEDDDDWGEFDEEMVLPPEKARLNENTKVVFSNPITFNKHAAPVAAAKPTLEEEMERIKRLHNTAQGEASMLRSKLNQQEGAVAMERMKHKQREHELQAKMKEEQKKFETETSKLNTQKMFLVQEMQEMKDRLRKLETERLRESQSPDSIAKRRKALGTLHQEKNSRNSFPTELEFRKQTVVKTSETQTAPLPVEKPRNQRKCSLKPINKNLSLQSFIKTTDTSAEVKSRLYEQADNRRYYQQELSLLVTRECEDITDSLPSLPSVDKLEYLELCRL